MAEPPTWSSNLKPISAAGEQAMLPAGSSSTVEMQHCIQHPFPSSNPTHLLGTTANPLCPFGFNGNCLILLELHPSMTDGPQRKYCIQPELMNLFHELVPLDIVLR